MFNRLIALPAALAIGGLAVAAFYARADDTSGKDQSAGQSYKQSDAQSAGAQTAAALDQSSKDQIQKAFSRCVEAAVKTDGFNDLVNCLSREDRDRIQAQKPTPDQLNQTAGSISQSWREKYGQDFAIPGDQQVFTAFTILPGESPEAQTAGARIGAAGQEPAAGQQAGGVAGQSEQTRAHILIPASHGLPQCTLNCVKEGADWKIDVPDSIDGNQLCQNLQQQLSAVQQDNSNWPATMSDAQPMIAHRVALSLAGQQAVGSGDAEAQSPAPAPAEPQSQEHGQ